MRERQKRLERLLRILRRQLAQKKLHLRMDDAVGLPFSADEFAALIRSPDPTAMKKLAAGLGDHAT